jgi:hypothetical protein
MQAPELLNEARRLYDNPDLPFARIAMKESWRSGFASGAEWMLIVLSHRRGHEIPPTHAPYNLLGIVKYGLAVVCALAYAASVWMIGMPILLPGAVFVFYAIEAQMVFLFLLAIDGKPYLFSESRLMTQEAGGTLTVMMTVMRLAIVMIFGGFLGMGFVRAWALGCLSVVLWYEEVCRVENRVTG